LPVDFKLAKTINCKGILAALEDKMDNELAEIISFVEKTPPFEFLSKAVLNTIVRELNICYLRKGEYLPPKGDSTDEAKLYLLRSGALSYFSNENELLGKYGEGDICTVFCRGIDNKKMLSSIKVRTDEDTLLYSICYKELQNLVGDYPHVSAFLTQSAAQRLSVKMDQVNDEAIIASSLMNTQIKHFYHSPVASVASTKSIKDAAIMMTEHGYSCLVILDVTSAVNKTEPDMPIGIVTDKDIRRRCVAQGLSNNEAVGEIMTSPMLTIDVNENAYDALMTMTSKHIHHLPVTEFGQLVGMVTVTDLMNNEGHNAINLTSLIHKAKSIDDLVEVSKLLPKLQIRMAKLGTTADHVSKSISAITMAFTNRLIAMAEKLYGQAPVPYAWLAAGSQARQEQFAHSDQDNALIISDEMKPEDDYWFYDLATFVSDGLAACGFVYCPGDIMATNPKWRKTQAGWHKYFEQWVNTPDGKALLNASVFFDLATVSGDASLLNEVRKRLLNQTKGSSLFIAHLSRNALQNKPPLGFFRDFVLKANGKNKAVLDLKHNGIAPIVDLARIYALSQGIDAVNTLDRLRQSAGTTSLTKEASANLIDAYEFLSLLRATHQADKLRAGESPDNFLSPKALSKLEREHLKDAFKVIKTMQDYRQSNL